MNINSTASEQQVSSFVSYEHQRYELDEQNVFHNLDLNPNRFITNQEIEEEEEDDDNDEEKYDDNQTETTKKFTIL